MSYTVLDGIDFLGNPELDLPFDEGDGPFARPTPGPNSERAAAASSDAFLQNEEKQNSRLEGGQRLVAAGTINVSDIIPARSFRRVQRDVGIPAAIAANMQELRNSVLVRFQGAASAVLAEKINDSQAGGPATSMPDVLLAMIELANRAAENEKSSSDGRIDFRSPLPPSRSFYSIRYRQPALEFPMFSPGVDYLPSAADGVAQQNTIHEFSFNVDGRKQFEFRYPMGRRIPVTFDIINRGDRAISADLFVEVIVRT